MNRHGFSLLELSIVLVIIGLIAGGIVAGSSMIRAAELRAVITEQEQFKTAVYTFRDKYLGLPGDLKNAGAFWGYPNDDITNCPATAGTGTETCDGNGNNSIEASGATTEYSEMFMFWQQLANAELLSGAFTGIAGSTPTDSNPGVNTPETRISGGAWAAHDALTSSHCGAGNRYTSIVGPDSYNQLVIGANATGIPSTPLLSPEEAWGIDTKVDDGKPGLGKIKAFCPNSCSDVTDAATSEYILSDDSPQCWLTISLE